MASLKKGDSKAFAHFVREYQDMVFACCRMVGLSENDSEDAASETFLAAFQSIHQYNGNGKLEYDKNTPKTGPGHTLSGHPSEYTGRFK